MFTDPLAVTYDGSAKSLPRVSGGKLGTVYRTADAEFEVRFSDFAPTVRNAGGDYRFVLLSRNIPDPTPANVFDDYRNIRNAFGYFYAFDRTRSEASVDIPRLRTALDSFMTSTIQSRVIGGEK